MKKIFITCLIAGVLTSCLDDKGNYTYTELNEVKIEGLEKPVNDISEKEEAPKEDY